ncbi:helix-turn-helix domain-containing protein [Flavihumibacter profundi]|uniref:helix-turn-helix domain-containing protein n=1 Tax=Flavihumibacter profundi TaxID=2716883 RepID=UPI001CC475B7|nr:helix-turn-helix transcriptional regulator [Flavihumibacter profundi]MBZ5859437.1 helix-turn-helix domain-containing protein [Flavihumibacter profundi]
MYTSETIPNKFGKLIKFLREFKEMTQEQLASATGLTSKQIEDAESGNEIPTLDLMQLVDYFGFDSERFLKLF